jgi:Arylsulfotransferase Ig-like domain
MSRHISELSMPYWVQRISGKFPELPRYFFTRSRPETKATVWRSISFPRKHANWIDQMPSLIRCGAGFAPLCHPDCHRRGEVVNQECFMCPIRTQAIPAEGDHRDRALLLQPALQVAWFQSLLSALLVLPASSSFGVTLLTGPSFVRATNAPLAGVLQLTTDVEARISVSVNDGSGTWTRCFHNFSQTHSVPLLGFKPGRTNQIVVTVCDKAQSTYTAPQSVTFITAPLPPDFPHSTVLKSDPSKMEPGFTLFIVQNRTAKAS